ncbi:MAG TPA: hypothetical protein P5142_00205 [Spirochaetia bacterium]|nr:hypothetical protein [Spirochaetia bacterium]
MEALSFFTLQADDWNQPEAVALRLRYKAEGWAMQGRYWALCGIVARAGGSLDLGEDYVRAYTMRALELEEEPFKDLLSKLEAVRLIVITGQVVSVPSVDEDRDRMHTASTRGKKAAASRWKAGSSPPSKRPSQEDPPRQAEAPPPPPPADPDPPNPSEVKEEQPELILETPQDLPAAAPMHVQCTSNAHALHMHMHPQCTRIPDAMRRKEGRKEKTERALQALSVFSSGRNQEARSAALVDNSALPGKRSPPRPRSGEVEEDSWLELAHLWGPLFEWAAREARGLQANPVLYLRTERRAEAYGIAAAGA